jgi:LuxR family maltose regulon positive regulatory protein
MAVIHQALGRTDEALVALGHAFARAEPQGFVRLFVDEGEVMKALLQQVVTRDGYEAYARKLFVAFADQVKLSADRSGEVELAEPLSAREIQVLRLMNSRLSVPEIADEIHLAPTTVRTHVQNIFRKLDVHGRIEALQRAEELGLI